MDIFEACHKINSFLISGKELEARNELILLLDYIDRENKEQSPLINHLIREVGLYPYLKLESSEWQDRFAYEAFKADVGGGTETTLHREQSRLLKRLLDNKNIAVSAPTSFGKSFVVDAFIAIRKPKNVVVIVPTIALTDETRRRLYKKFAGQYNFITTANAEPEESNIFIFPAERAIGYVNKIDQIDILIIDEFYKASSLYDKERSPALLRAILALGEKASQRYYLAPNITQLEDNIFTKEMEFENLLGFNTVFLNVTESYKEIEGEKGKSTELIKILAESSGKSLIYAGTYPDIDKVTNLLIDQLPQTDFRLPNLFADWLSVNYEENWKLTNLSRRGIGVHTGALHRSISQLQIRLFEEPEGFNSIISTSSIIEGVNTSAENVVIWRNKNGQANLNDFTYKNIIGRGGRMFKHFVGKVFLLEPPPDGENATLDIPFPDTLLGHIDETLLVDNLSDQQVETIRAFREEMYQLMGKAAFDELLGNNVFQSANTDLIRAIAQDMKQSPQGWKSLLYLHSEDPDEWDRALYKLLNLPFGRWETGYKKLVTVTKALSANWTKDINSILDDLAEHNIGIDDFFKCERVVTHKLAALLGDINELQKTMLQDQINVSDFTFKLSHGFLPPVVHQLEEYGLPRMVSRKIHNRGLIDLTLRDLTIKDAIYEFHRIGIENVLNDDSFIEFDRYIINYFYEGITFESFAKDLES